MRAREGRDLTLIVPGLFGLEPPAGTDAKTAIETLVSGLDLSALETLLSRAGVNAAKGRWQSPEDLVFTAFGYPRPAGDWPVAAVTRAADFDAGDQGEWWIRADPVHLKADMGNLVLFDGEHFALDRVEARELADIVEEHFSHLGWRLNLLHPMRWYLKLETPARIQTTPLSMARLCNVDAYLPGGEEAKNWHKHLNETQMVLHDCAVNRSREARGELPVNSLWFWGGGLLPPARAADWSEVYSDSPLLQGLARHAGIGCHPLPDGAEWWLNGACEGRHLALIETGHSSARSGNVEAWREFIVALSANWFEPLLHALKDGRLQSMTVLTDRYLRYHAGRARWWWWLKARRPFSRLVQL
jgi:hypothetical protein